MSFLQQILELCGYVWLVISSLMFVVCTSRTIIKRETGWKRWPTHLIFALFCPLVWVLEQFQTLYNGYFAE